MSDTGVREIRPVTQADRIRKRALNRWITPARSDEKTALTIRAGDVHREMGLSNAISAVCSALGSNKFSVLAGVTLRRTEGPANGANVYFQYSLFRMPPAAIISAPDRIANPGRAPESNLDLKNALVLVCCVKSKLPHAAAARDLYTSAWFSKVRDLVEASGATWFVLSSRYGLVLPSDVIEPYDYTLNTLGRTARRQWADKVLNQLQPRLERRARVVILGGARYYEFLVEPLRARGMEVNLPLQRLGRGPQLAWLAKHE